MEASGAYKWRALATVSVGAFMATVDASIVNIAFPTLADVFDTSPDTVIWVALGYILVSTGLTLTLGRVGDLLGRKRIYASGFLVFSLGLALCAVAQSLTQLIAFRVLQSVGAAMIIANGTAIVTDAFPARQRGQALGMLGSVVGAGLATGPVLGGALLTALDWRAIFYLQVPVGIVGSLVAARVLREQQADHADRSIDYLGAGALFVTLSTFILAVNRGEAWGWGSPVILGLGGVALVGLAGVLMVEGKLATNPIISLGMFRNRLFSAAVASLLLSFLATSGIPFLMPFYLVKVLDLSAAAAGAVMATVPVTMLLMAPVAGSLSDRFGSRYLSTTGLVFTTIGLLSLRTIGADTPALGVVLRLLIVGFGAGFFQSPNNSSIMGSVSRDRLGTASAMIATARSTGQATGLALAGAIFAYGAAAAVGADTVESADLGTPAILSGVHNAFLVAAGIAAVAAVTSMVRGSQPREGVPASGPPAQVGTGGGQQKKGAGAHPAEER